MSPRDKLAKAANDNDTKLFVLDTNVLLHDPTSLFRFEEHDICLPMFVLEELDNKKKGMTEVARNARQASRFLDQIVSDAPHKIEKGIALGSDAHKNSTGRLYLRRSGQHGHHQHGIGAGLQLLVVEYRKRIALTFAYCVWLFDPRERSRALVRHCGAP